MCGQGCCVVLCCTWASRKGQRAKLQVIAPALFGSTGKLCCGHHCCVVSHCIGMVGIAGEPDSMLIVTVPACV
jgi:hypothetical protein